MLSNSATQIKNLIMSNNIDVNELILTEQILAITVKDAEIVIAE